MARNTRLEFAELGAYSHIMIKPRIIGFAGSTRDKSFNKILVRAALNAAQAAGAEVTFIDLRDLALPLYDEDLESKSGAPDGAKRLKDLMRPAHGLLIASPEYNSSVSASLKNAIDWASRPEPGQPPLACFTGKVAGLLAASPGALGGLRGLVHLRAILGNIGVIVLPQQVAVMKAADAFNEAGTLKDEKQQASVVALAAAVVSTSAKLAAS